jgi:hypothetical protein
MADFIFGAWTEAQLAVRSFGNPSVSILPPRGNSRFPDPFPTPGSAPKRKHPVRCFLFGAWTQARTGDLFLFREALYQLSYPSICVPILSQNKNPEK